MGEVELNLLLRRAFDASPSGIIVGRAASPHKRVIYVNPAAREITGVPAEEGVGHDFMALFGTASGTRLQRRLQKALDGSNGHRQIISFSRQCDGRKLWVQISVSPVQNLRGEETHYVAILDDVTDRTLAEQELSQLAVRDYLTGLPNRSLIEELLARAMASHSRHRRKLCVAFVDLDRLKAVNDTLGHAAGDLLLRQVAGRLRGRLRRSDSVGRLGGDEFVILLTDVGDPVAIKTLAGKILGCFDEPFDLGVGEVSISASLGICLFPDHGSSPEELLRNADAAMYQAKFEGGNTYRFFSPRMKRNRSLLVPTTGPAAP